MTSYECSKIWKYYRFFSHGNELPLVQDPPVAPSSLTESKAYNFTVKHEKVVFILLFFQYARMKAGIFQKLKSSTNVLMDVCLFHKFSVLIQAAITKCHTLGGS